MRRGLFLILLGVFLFTNAELADNESPHSAEDCVQHASSMPCVQLGIFRSLKTFFDRSRVDLIGGLSIVHDNKGGGGDLEARSARSFEIERKFDVAGDFETRQTALESYAVERVVEFFGGRSLRWEPTALVEKLTATFRSVKDNMPAGVNKFLTQFLTDGRGRKKTLERILPLLIGMKLKLGVSIIIAALGVALLAKKAILASIISIAISSFIIFKKLFSHHYYPHYPHLHESYPHHVPWAVSPVYGGVYSSPVAAAYNSGDWDPATSYSASDVDTYGSHSSPVAHKVAYSAQKPKRR